jgi:heme O synthase-like polyprenyltransferase
MKSAIAARPDTLTIVRSRSADYLELIRPRIASMVLFTVAAGFCLAEARTPDLARLLHTAFGTALVVAGATALNQVLEQNSDALMERTRQRPLPSGRLQRGEVFLFGAILALSGLLYLMFTVRQRLVVLEAGFAFGIWFVTCAIGFLLIRSVTRARRVLRASLVYLPALLTLLIVEAVFKNWA